MPFYLLLLTSNLSAQVIIKEKVEINPNGIILPEDGIIDSRNPFYLRHGGNITLFSQRGGGGYEIWEETLGKITFGEGNNPPNTCSIGTFPQWHKFYFYAKHYETGQIYYPLEWGLADEGSNPGWVEIHPSYVPGDPFPYPPDISFVVFIEPDYSLASMPPGEILQYFSDPINGNPFSANPFVPSKKINIPVDGDIFAVVQYANTAISDLWVEYPNKDALMLDSLVFQIVGTNIGDTIYLGKKFAGDSINFYIRSSNTVVSESKLYPLQQFEEDIMPDGDILMWNLQFEDWTDLYFDNLTIGVYFRPDSSSDYSPVSITFEPNELAPGDTARIIIKRQFSDGTFEDFPEQTKFEIGVMDGCEGGEILFGDSVGIHFTEVNQPIYFVANSSIADTSITVGIRVGVIDEIIEGRPITKNGDQNEAEIISENNQRINKPKTNKTNLPNSPLLNPVSYCFNGTIQQYLMGDANLVVGKNCSDLISCESNLAPVYVNYKFVPSGLVYKNPVVCTPNKLDSLTGLIQTQNGGFIALNWRADRSQTIDVSPCYNKENKTVHFKMLLTDVETNQKSIILKPEALLEICEDNISRANLILIKDTVQLLNIMRNYPTQIPIIKKDIDSTLSRYNATIVRYKFLDEIMTHELEHKKDYESYLSALKQTFLEEPIEKYLFTCKQFNNDPYALSLAKTKYLKIVQDYIKEVNLQAHIKSDDNLVQQRLSVQGSLWKYKNLIFKFENKKIF